MTKRRVNMGEIGVGSVLPWDVFDDDGRLLLSKGHVVASENQIESLIERGLFTAAVAKWDRDKQAALVEHERSSAAALILDARYQLQAACAPGAPKENFAERVMRVRLLIQDACKQSENVALATILHERDERYSIRHSVDVAICCQVVGASMDIQEPELAAIVAAALTMNISMLPLQDELQGQRQPLTAEQREAIVQHPQQSAAMLEQLGVTDKLWIDVVLNHHEAIDGGGYPSHKKGDAIPLPAQLVAMADVYCARVSGRDYRPALRPNTALKALFLNQGATMNRDLAGRFVKAIGIYPPGTPVRIVNGEIAIVIGQGEKANTPLVASLIGPGGNRFAVPIQRDTSRPAYTVSDVVDWSTAGPLPGLRVLWGKEGAVG